MNRPARISLALLLLFAWFEVSPTPARAQDEEAAPEASEDAILQEDEAGTGSGIENDAEVEDTHNPADAGDSAEGGDPADQGAVIAPTATPLKAKRQERKQPSRRWPYRDKQAEGTKAKKRSNQDFVIHSQYELNGRKLEVDPD